MRLDGRRIVVCRARHQAEPLLEAIAAEGAEPVHVPLIEVAAPLDGGAALRSALSSADTSTWILATSANGIDAIAHACSSRPELPPVLTGRLAVVGRATAARAAGWNLPVVFESPERSAAGLARTLPISPDERAIAAVAELAGPDLSSILSARGVEVEVVTAYRTVAPEVSDVDRQRITDADLVLVTSPSVVERLCSSVGASVLPPLVAIGSTTARAIRESGLSVADTAEAPSVDALIDAAVLSLES